MKIGEISKTTGIPVETIRYYEKIGLVVNSPEFRCQMTACSNSILL